MADDMSPRTASALPRYTAMFRDFVEGRTDANEFEQIYLRDYLNDPTPWDQWVFDVLDGVFAAADAYVDDHHLRPQVLGGLDAAQLRAAVASALDRLER